MDTGRDNVFKQEFEDGINFLPCESGIYCIINRNNGKRYVGQAKDIYRRCLQHRSELRRGAPSNMLLRRDVTLHGPGAFFFFALRIDFIADSSKAHVLNKIEIWFASQLSTHDERLGYNMEAGHHRSRAARLRDRERKLMRSNSQKYQLLPGVDMYDPIHPDLLSTWVPGN